jgi:hypothetical protein
MLWEALLASYFILGQLWGPKQLVTEVVNHYIESDAAGKRAMRCWSINSQSDEGGLPSPSTVTAVYNELIMLH